MALALVTPARRREVASTLDPPSGMLAAMSRVTRSFVGRTRELEEIRTGIDDARAGRGSLWLITGEPGIGKSRLIEEVARIAADADVRVMWGRCWEAGGAPAYWPWIQVLRGVLRLTGEGRAVAAGNALADELMELLPELVEPASRPSRPELEPNQARFRLLDSVSRVLCDAARSGPMLLLLEDLHTADPSSLLLLDFLARQLQDVGLLVLGTYRPAEAQRNATGDALARLAVTSHHLALSRLNRDEVTSYLATTLDAPPEPSLCDAVYAASEGNPLFVGELARLHARAPLDVSRPGLALLAGIRSTLRARLMTLTETTRSVLSMAAVVGRECRVATVTALARGSDLAVHSVHQAIDEAIDAEILQSHGPGVLRFSHILLQQVLYADLDETTRQALHRRAAAEVNVDGHGAALTERAHHLLAAGPEAAQEAVRAAIDAAESASRQYAFSEAVTWYTQAHSTLQRVPHADVADTERCDLLLALARAQIVAHEIEAGRAHCEAAASIARTLQDADRLAQAALAYGAVFVIAEVNPKLVALLNEALTLLPTQDHPLRARVMARLAAAMQPALDPQTPVALARDAVAMARRVGDKRVLLSTLRAAGSALMDMTDPAECTELHGDHVALATELDDSVELFHANLRLVFSAYAMGDVARARLAIAACERVGEALGQPHFVWRVEAMKCLRAMWEGHLDDAHTHMERARTLGQQAADPNAERTYACQRITWLRTRGNFAEALAHLTRVDTLLVPALGNLPSLALYMAAERVRAGSSLRVPDVYLPHNALGLPQVVDDTTMFDTLVVLALELDDRPLIERLYERGLPRAREFVSGGVFGFTWEQPIRCGLAKLAHRLGRHSEAREHYEAALQLLRGLRAKPFFVWNALDAAKFFEEVGDVQRARELWSEARSVAQALEISLPSFTTALVENGATGVPETAPLRMRREGDYWSVEQQGRAFRIKDGKGVAMLARLVERAGEELHVLDLVGNDGVIDRGDAGELLDPAARAQYQARVRELTEDLAEAEQNADFGRAERAQTELSAITQELSRAFALGGKARRAGSSAERARINVQRRLRDAIQRIAAHDAALGRHFEWAIKTGTYCSYLRK